MRLFVQIPITDYIREQVKDVQDKFRDLGNINFVDPELFHYTIKFLGEPEGSIEEVKSALSEVEYPKFNLHSNGIGVFPNIQDIRVLWIGAENRREISRFHKKIEEKMINIGYDPHDYEVYTPHLTFGRVRNVKGEDKREMTRLIKEMEDLDIGNYEVDKFQLMKSELTPDGSVYEVLENYDLK